DGRQRRAAAGVICRNSRRAIGDNGDGMSRGGRESRGGAKPPAEQPREAEPAAVGRPASHWFASPGERIAAELPAARFQRQRDEREATAAQLRSRLAPVQRK